MLVLKITVILKTVKGATTHVVSHIYFVLLWTRFSG